MSPGGLDSSEPELDPGTVFGRLAACTGRERDGGQGIQRNNGSGPSSMALKKKDSRWERQGRCLKASGAHCGYDFSTHTPGNSLRRPPLSPPVSRGVPGRTRSLMHWHHFPSRVPESPLNKHIFNSPYALTPINFS